MRKRIFTIRHHGMQHVDEDLIDGAINETYGGSPQYLDEELDTAQFGTDLDGVNWDGVHEHVWTRAQELKERFSARPSARITYFGGFPEVAAALALGAYIGEEWEIEPHDLHHGGDWSWLRKDPTLFLSVRGIPAGVEPYAGPAAIAVELSAEVLQDEIDKFVNPRESVGTIRIRTAHKSPTYGDSIHSAADVLELRRETRTAIAKLLAARPNTTTLHVFLAGPPSAAFAIGQELRLRNTRLVQTYRYRNSAQGPNTTPAILLRPTGPAPTDNPLTDADVAAARTLRDHIWKVALKDLQSYVAVKRQDSQANESWHARLAYRAELSRVNPFPTLPTIASVFDEKAIIDDVPLAPPDDYAYSLNTWKVSDEFLLRLEKAIGVDEAKLRTLVRLFLLHETSHKQHFLVKGKVDEVGKFPNCLERADYTADLYAILHELDRGMTLDASALTQFELLRARVSDLIDLLIRSFWAFESPVPVARMEVRRLRRHLNWYWQLTRVQRTQNALQLFAVLARQPFIELAGCEHSVSGRRIFCSLRRFDPNVGLELGIVLDNEEIWRVKNSATVPLARLVDAFAVHDHEAVLKLFGRVFEDVAGSKNALPDPTLF